VGNYVLMSYGDGAVMGVPAHDERDFAFALKYDLPIKQVVGLERASASPAAAPGSSYASGKSSPGAPAEGASLAFDATSWQEWYASKAGVCLNSGDLDGLGQKAAVDKVAELLAAKGLGEKKTTWRLRDWGISRQRYWGTPIPIIHCDEHGAVPVPEKDLPVVLPQDCIPDGSGNPLHKHQGFHHGVVCPTCGKPARRETDTMDTFVDSSWYFLRYCDPANKQAMVADGAAYWAPMDQYIGGIEHAILHLLYARFWTKVMRDLNLITFDEPFQNLLTQGMVLNETYYSEDASGKKTWLNPLDVELDLDEKGRPQGAKLIGDASGTPVVIGGVEKMSKSKNNGVDPQALIDQYGADTARLFVMFAAPPEQQLEWSGAGVDGASRFLRRVWMYSSSQAGALRDASDSLPANLSDAEKELRRAVHTILKQANFDYQRRQYNTVVSAAMKMLNTLEPLKLEQNAAISASVLRECLSILLRVLYPVVPHMTHVLWKDLGYAKSFGPLLDAPWPSVDEAALVQTELTLMLQINGKLRGDIKVPADASKE
jgi:leucyl-tRNA synthetase